MALVTPDNPGGSETVNGPIQFTLPPYSYLPGLSQAETDVADLIAAAMDTEHFPEAKQSHITLTNKRIGLVFPNKPPTKRGPNRRVRRQQLKKGRK